MTKDRMRKILNPRWMGTATIQLMFSSCYLSILRLKMSRSQTLCLLKQAWLPDQSREHGRDHWVDRREMAISEFYCSYLRRENDTS